MDENLCPFCFDEQASPVTGPCPDCVAFIHNHAESTYYEVAWRMRVARWPAGMAAPVLGAGAATTAEIATAVG
jgi:hypothetical protein